MFRSVTVAIVACASALVLAATPATAAAKSTKSKSTSTSKEHSMVGTLQKVDGQTLTVKTSSGEQSVMLAPTAHITQAGKAVQPSQLSSDTGSHVKVRYTESNGQKQAQVVTLSPASARKVAKK